MKATMRKKGGKGSGNWGHRGRPGKVGGSLSGTGGLGITGALPEMSHDTKKRLANELYWNRRRSRHAIEMTAKDLGFDPKKVVYAGKPYSVTVGGDKYEVGARYRHDTREIELYDGAFADKDYLAVHQEVMAHEIMHDKFKKYMDTYEEQLNEIWDTLHNERDNNVPRNESIMRDDGSLRNEEDQKKYALYIHQNMLIRQHFTKREGFKELYEASKSVSKYAHSYWKEAMMAGSSSYFFRAINETMAEVHRMSIYERHKVPGVFWQMYEEILELVK